MVSSDAIASPGAASSKSDIPFDGVVRLTRLGGGYLIFTLIVGFAALNTGNNSLYIALSFMFGMLLFSGIASRSGIRSISVEIDSHDDFWAGSSTDGTLRLANGSWLWSVRDLIVLAPELERPVVVPILPRRSSREMLATFRFERRGHARIRRLELYTRYPFGLFLKKKIIRMDTDVLVFPRLLSGKETNPDVPELGDLLTYPRPGEGQEIYALREYVHGDSVRDIHWKKSAGVGKWIIKQHASDAAGSIHLSLDPYLPHGVDKERFEELVSEAATLVRDAVARGSNIVLHMGGEEIREGLNEGPRPIFEALALVEPSRELLDPPDYVVGAIVFSLRDEAA